MRTCVMTYIWSSLWRRQVEIYHHCMSACLCVCICCKHVGVNVGISCVAVYQSLLGGFSPVDSFLICCPCVFAAYLLIRFLLCYAVKHVCVQHFCLYLCVHVLQQMCAFIHFMALANIKALSSVSTPCTGSSKAMSAAKDQRCRGSMVTTYTFVNLQGCWLPCKPGFAGLQHPTNSSLSTRQGFDCLSCRPGLW